MLFKPLKKFLIIHLGHLLTRLLGSSLRYTVVGLEQLERYQDKNGFVISGWHGQQLICFYFFRHKGYHGLASLSRDGEYISAIMGKLGWKPIRGSKSKGAVRGLLELIQLLRQGAGTAITPDGPRGPLHTVAPGAIYACQKSGAALIPIAFAFDRKWVLYKTWDQFVIPKPFARCVVYLGEPLSFQKEKLTAEALCAEQTKVQNAIQHTNILAEALLKSLVD